MTHLIDKDALVAEIERRINFNEKLNAHSRLDECNAILSFIDKLEVKEVDLEKHLKEDIEDVLFDLDGVAVKGATHYLTVEDVKDIAKHFFELGLNTQRNSINIPNIDDLFEEEGIDPNSKEAKIFKESYYMALEKLIEKKGE